MTSSLQETAYWLYLAFGDGRPTRREVNALVLTAHRREGLGLLDLVRRDLDDLPSTLVPHAPALRALQAAEGKVSAQAFVAAELERRQIALLPITDDAYPAHLARRLTPAAAPTVLLVAGDLARLRSPGVAISGSRAAGAAGLAFARACGRALTERSLAVVSGLARGVDSEGLEGALDAGGSVIGVAAEGLLVSRWAHGHNASTNLTVISEFAPRQPWRAGAAMARNRTIAGMSRALIIADCVAPGGTTNQVEVHRRLGLRVLVRRGEGEGAMVEQLAAEAGVEPILWDGGAVTLPALLEEGGDSPAPALRESASTSARVKDGQVLGAQQVLFNS